MPGRGEPSRRPFVTKQRATAPLPSSRQAEFERVNEIAGVEPVQRELSGLVLRDVPPPAEVRTARSGERLAYRWRPSVEYRSRQDEIRRTNRWIRGAAVRRRALPPILSYVEETDIQPTRLQPMLHRSLQVEDMDPLPSGARDLRDLEAAERTRVVPTIAPVPQQTDTDYLINYRPLLPRQYRRFLRSSPYPRVLLGALAALLTLFGWMWMTQLQRADANALRNFRRARTAVHVELARATGWGVSPVLLRPLRARAAGLNQLSPPDHVLPSRTAAQEYDAQQARYASLLRTLHHLEARALRLWTDRESMTYASLSDVVQEGANVGLVLATPAISACSTPRCFQRLIPLQQEQTRRLRQTVRTLRVYAAAVAGAPDPAASMSGLVRSAQSLRSTLPTAHVPVGVALVTTRSAGALTVAAQARVAAVAHLDLDALRVALTRSLPRRAVVVSRVDASLDAYQGGRSILHASVDVGPLVPTGQFAVTLRQKDVPVTLWNASSQYVSGLVPYLVGFGAGAALQSAPWRISFGVGGGMTAAGYAPNTPAAVDLPASAAAALYGWVSDGTEVVVY